MQVRVRLFALAKQTMGRSELSLALPDTATVADLKVALTRDYPELAPLLAHLMIAVNSEYAADDWPIGAESELALIPPVSGGATSRPRSRNDSPPRTR